MKLNCAIVDDEFLARQYLRDYVGRVPFLNLIGDYDSPVQVFEDIKNGNIDLLFLDIQMPDISGLDFLKSVNPQPYIIFTTAYSEYALAGYEHNTVDYLLKPFSFERFLKAVNKAFQVASLVQGGGITQTASVEAKGENESKYLTIRADRKIYRLNLDEIYYFEGQSAYVTIHSKTRKITALLSLKDLEEDLPVNVFARIHKSYIVALKYIDFIEGNQVFICGDKLPVGRNYKQRIQDIFNLPMPGKPGL